MKGGRVLRFPVFWDLPGRAVTVVGGGTVARRRAVALGRFGADVTVIAREFSSPVEGAVCLVRDYRRGDLEGAFLALAATDDRAVNHAAYAAARERGIPVNVCDCPGECYFFFPALCEAGGVVAGVAGDGSDHKKTARAAAIIRRAWEEEL